MLSEPRALPDQVDGLIAKRKVDLPADLVATAEGIYSDPVSTAIDVAACYGATPVLIKTVLKEGDFDELFDLMRRYFGVVGPLQFRAWSLLQARQALQFHLSAARAENRLRNHIRHTRAETHDSDSHPI
jgi:molybdenum cofactor biosynthesis enzyme MoaA